MSEWFIPDYRKQSRKEANSVKPQTIIALSVLILAMLACASSGDDGSRNSTAPGGAPGADDPLPQGDPAQGKLLFSGQGDGEFQCSACHSLQPDQRLVGPSLAGIGITAATRLEGYSAEEYLRESILQPNAYVVEGFKPDIMPENLGKRMSAQQQADLIAYLMTLK
jgi:cytochrome c2